MKSYIRGSLLVVSALFVIWGLGFIFFPGKVHGTLSYGTFDQATASLFAAALLGLALIFLIEAQDPNRERVYGLAATLGFLGIATGLGMLKDGGMNVNGWTIFSVIITIGVALYLFIVQSEAVAAGEAAAASKPKTQQVKKTSKAKVKAKSVKTAKKKAAKKKVAKKKARKRR